MAEYIEREAALESVRGKLLISESLPDSIGKRASIFTLASMNDSLKSIPASDVVSRGAYDQTDWERCVALTQLKEIGKGLGERMDDVRPVVRGEWIGEADGYADGELVYDTWYCSCCDFVVDDDEKPRWRFCPNCGAEMRTTE